MKISNIASTISLLYATLVAANDEHYDNEVKDLDRGLKKKEIKTLGAVLEKDPSYEGDLEPFGSASLYFNSDGSFLFMLSMTGLESSCSDCNVTIVDDNGDSYYSGESDPWSVGETYYFTNSEGMGSNSFTVYNGYNRKENEGMTVNVYDSGNNLVASGTLMSIPKSNKIEAVMGPYPGYDGHLDPRGTVSATFDGTKMTFQYKLKGFEAYCDKCGIHIHIGMTCDDKDLVYGHYWNDMVVQDLWTSTGGAVYSTNVKGIARGSFMITNGYGFEENYGHAVVVHSSTGSRMACGVLK